MSPFAAFFRNTTRPALLVVLGFSMTPGLAGKLYKWVDEDGQVRYSDTLPSEQVRKPHQQLDPDGRVIESHAARKSAEEIRREREEEQRRVEAERLEAERQAKIRAEKEHHDRVLLMTFTSLDEIRDAEQERVAVIDSVIGLLRRNIDQEIQTIESLEARAMRDYISQGQEVPGGLAQSIEYFNEKLLNKQKQLELKLDERQRIKRQYAEDMIRFDELTRQQNNGS
jgi:uncharacterized protein YaiL (DUF2058 family)